MRPKSREYGVSVQHGVCVMVDRWFIIMSYFLGSNIVLLQLQLLLPLLRVWERRRHR